MDGHFARFGAEYKALNAQDIADIHGFKVRVYVLAHILAAHIDLNLALAVQKMHKGGLAHNAAAHHTAGNAHSLVFQLVKAGQNVRGGMGAVKTGNGVGVAAIRLVFAQLFPADLFLFAQVQGRIFGHGYRSLTFGFTG